MMRFVPVLSLLSLFPAASSWALPDLEKHPGRAVYEKLCLDCHGANGEGDSKGEVDPLEGNRDIASLAGKIERTMPEDEEHLCVGEDAKSVAEYIYHAFYSPEARARNTPARIELQRLTVPQYQRSVADLVASFRNGSDRWIGEKRGWNAHYFGGFKHNERKEVREAGKKDRYERVEPVLRHDFGEKAPNWNPEMNFIDSEFSAYWEGMLLAPETGTYEFVVRTRNGVEFWVNERDENVGKTIDGYVAPDNEIRELKGSVYLIAGRWYPIKLKFFKYKEKAAFVELKWKPPHGVLGSIPTQYMGLDWHEEDYVVQTTFPADDRSVGYERGTAVSKAWFDAVTSAAIEAADYVVEHLDRLARTKTDDPKREEKIGAFGVDFATRAFRRPLTEAERVALVDKQYKEAESVEQAVKRLVLLVLKDPRFLYPGLEKDSGNWGRADRLALTLWDSIPDAKLRQRAMKDQLKNREQIEKQAWEMISNPRTKAKLRGFFSHWLELERAADLSKDKAVFPEFDPGLISDLRMSLDLFLEEVAFTENSDYRQLLQADYLFLNHRLAKIYGEKDTKVEGSGFEKVKFAPNRRSGVVTHPFLLSTFAYHNNTSPIHRGVFLTRNIVGMGLNSPEMANEFVEGNFDPTLTMREKVEDLTRAKACMACHTTINPLGFSLEHYDGIGRWRWKDKDKPIDAKSEFKTDSGETIKLSGARDVADFAANRPSAHEAFVEQLFHHMVKQPMLAYGLDVPGHLNTEFRNSGFNIRLLMVKIATLVALHEE